jgi:hypothetical protein
MRGDLSKALALIVSALVTVGSTGCGSRLITSLPEPPPKARATGPVALVMPNAPPGVRIQQPGFANRGSTKMSESFDRRYVTATQAPLGPPAPPPAALSGLVLIGAGGLATRGAAAAGVGLGVGLGLGIGLGLVTGAIVVDSAKNTVAVLNAFADMRITEALASGIVEAGRSRQVLPPIVDRPDTATPAADFLLVLERVEVSLVSDDTSIWSPDLPLRMEVRAKLVRESDSEELSYWSWEHKGPMTSLANWGQDSAQPFRVELERALRTLAVRIVNDVAPDPAQTSAAEGKVDGGR